MRYICSRCSRLLSQDLRPSRSPLVESPKLRALWSAASSHNAYSSLAANDSQETLSKPQDERNPPKRPRTRSWSALLKKKALGQDSSVLVLRDSEAKKKAIEFSSIPENVAKSDSDTAVAEANRILSSMEDQNLAPEESEVFENIQALRPDTERSLGSFEGRPLLSIARYNRCVSKLAESFTRKQLKAFIANRLDSDGEAQQRAADEVSNRNKPSDKTNSINKAEQPQKPSRNTPVRSLEWKPITADERGSKKTVNERTRSKYIAGEVVRLVWGFEIKEYVAGRGSLDADVEAKLLPLLLVGGRSSALMDFSRRQDLKIEVNRKQNRLTIKGTKERCLGVVEDMNNLLRHAFTLKTALEPAAAKSVKRFAQEIADECKCFVKISNSSLIIRGLGQSSVQLCQRLLAAQVQTPLIGREISHIVGDSEWFFTPSTAIPDSLPHRLRRMEMGRLSTPKKLTSDPGGLATQQVSDSILASNLRDSINGLLIDNDRIVAANSALQSTLVAEFGHILHPIDQSTLLRPIPSDDLSNSLIHFAPTTIGLPQLLLNSFLEPKGKALEQLRIRLQPSPWKSSPSSEPASGWPDLEMILSPPNDSSQIHLKSIRAMLNHQAANIMIPAGETDLRLVRRDNLRLSHVEQQASVAAFVQAIQRSAAGFEGLNPPMFLRILMPVSMRRVESKSEKAKSAEDATEVSYFVTGVEQEDSLSSAQDDHILSYYRTAGDTINGSKEGLSLHQPFKLYANLQDERQASKAREDIDRFISAAEEMLKAINSPVSDESLQKFVPLASGYDARRESSDGSQRPQPWRKTGDDLNGTLRMRRVQTVEHHTRVATGDRTPFMPLLALAAGHGK